jgi:hypothetical protein
MLDNISIRGERGDNRELRPQFFFLKCPSCGNFRNCANVKLFTTTARGLTCGSCKKSTSSTRWMCEHGTPWTRCTSHREPGFRCGGQSLPSKRAFSKGIISLTSSFKAVQRRQANLRRIGSLGEPKSPPRFRDNSVNSSTFKRTTVQKKNIKRRGRPPLNGESRLRRPELHVSNNPQTSLGIRKSSSDNIIDRHANHATSIYWLAHSFKGQPRGSTSSNSHRFDSHMHQTAGSETGGPQKPAKIARLCEPFSKQASACKGNCPQIWTIESYCETCHR